MTDKSSCQDSPSWYDSREEMVKCLLSRGLAGLNDLANARHEAYYEKREWLREWYVLGNWFADQCGNFGKVMWPSAQYVPQIPNESDCV